MLKCIRFILVIIIIYNLSPAQSITTGWLRFCNDRLTWRANPNECPGGYWLKKSIRPQCVCAHGVWVLSKGYCDPNYVVIVGYHGTCFAFDAEVHWVRMIGHANNPFAPYYFMSTKFLDRIEPTDLTGERAEMLDMRPLVGAINPMVPQDDPDSQVCVTPHNVPFGEMPPDGLYSKYAFNFSPLRFDTDRWKFRQVEQCSFQSSSYTYRFVAGYSQIFQYEESKNWDWVTHNCSNTCLRKNEWSIEEQLKLILNETELTGENLKDDYPFSGESNNKLLFEHQWPKCNETENNWNRLPNRTVNEINEQTKRLMRTQVNWSLYKHKGPQVNLIEYNMFQKSRKVFEKVCPKDHVPTALLRGVLRMFRHALNESHPDDPYRRRGDQAEFDRIGLALQQCFDSPLPDAMSFLYNTTGCPPKLSSVIMKFNRTAPADARNVSCYVPCDLRFNKTKYDIPVEAAWKVILFTHYFCARHFNNVSYDHSRYIRKMEEFFNREIIHRWNNKGNSLKAIEFLFQMHDLEKFTRGMDCCVGAARSLSQYRKWIKRPEYDQICGQIEGGSYLAHRRKSPPKKQFDPENRFIISELGGRYYSNDSDPIWDGSAYCFTDWYDPLMAVPGYKAEAQAACSVVEGTIFWAERFGLVDE